MTRRSFVILLIVFAACALEAHSRPSPTGRNSERSNIKISEIRIDGADSQALEPLVRAWIDEYGRQHPGTRISYQALGSTAGLRMLAAGESSFGAIDVPEEALRFGWASWAIHGLFKKLTDCGDAS